MVTRRFPVGIYEFAVLAVLRINVAKTTERIVADLRPALGARVNIGSLYTTLEHLATKGYVAVKIGPSLPIRGGKRRRWARLTEAGKQAVMKTTDMLACLGLVAATSLEACTWFNEHRKKSTKKKKRRSRR